MPGMCQVSLGWSQVDRCLVSTIPAGEASTYRSNCSSTSNFVLLGFTQKLEKQIFFFGLVPQSLDVPGSQRPKHTLPFFPGTTLNLLKFPIINPTYDRIFRRQERLKEEATKTEDQLSSEEKKHLNHLKKQGYLVGEYCLSKSIAPLPRLKSCTIHSSWFWQIVSSCSERTRFHLNMGKTCYLE